MVSESTTHRKGRIPGIGLDRHPHSPCSAEPPPLEKVLQECCQQTLSFGLRMKRVRYNCNRYQEKQGLILENSQTAPFPIKSFYSLSKTVPQQVTEVSQRDLAPSENPAAQHSRLGRDALRQTHTTPKRSDTTHHFRHSQLNDKTPFPAAPSKKKRRGSINFIS